MTQQSDSHPESRPFPQDEPVDPHHLTISLGGERMTVSEALEKGLLSLDPQTGWFDTGAAYPAFRARRDRILAGTRRLLQSPGSSPSAVSLVHA